MFRRLKNLFRLECRVDRLEEELAKTRQELDDAIAALPKQIEDAVDAAVKPIIDKLNAAGDFQAEVDALSGMGEKIAAQVTTDLTPPTG